VDWFSFSIGARLVAGVLFFALLKWFLSRLGRGTGQRFFAFLVIVLALVFAWSAEAHIVGLIFLVGLIAWNELVVRKKNMPYKGALATIEGGGIKRGLSPPEAAVVLAKPLKLTLSLILFEMLRKGFIHQVQNFPLLVEVESNFRTHGSGIPVQERGDKRRLAAQAIPATLHKYEEAFLEIFEANPGIAVDDIDYGIALQPLVRYVSSRVGGFDLEETREYYRLIVDRAPKEARTDGALSFERQKVFDRNFAWILLGEEFGSVLDQDDYSYVPVWMRGIGIMKEGESFATWAEKVISSMDGVVGEDEVNLGLSRETDLVSATLMNEIARATFYG